MHRNGSDSTELLKSSDFRLIIFIILLAFLAFMYVHFQGQKGSSVTVTVDGKLLGTWSLSSDTEIVIRPESARPPGENQQKESAFYNVLQIRGGQAVMSEADCPDKICVRHRPISLTGESIVCLPHKVVVEITAENTGSGGTEENFDVIVR